MLSNIIHVQSFTFKLLNSIVKNSVLYGGGCWSSGPRSFFWIHIIETSNNKHASIYVRNNLCKLKTSFTTNANEATPTRLEMSILKTAHRNTNIEHSIFNFLYDLYKILKYVKLKIIKIQFCVHLFYPICKAFSAAVILTYPRLLYIFQDGIPFSHLLMVLFKWNWLHIKTFSIQKDIKMFIGGSESITKE